MKCDYCGNEGSRRGEWVEDNGKHYCFDCSKDMVATQQKATMAEESNLEDFRAFRRQVLLAIIASEYANGLAIGDDENSAWKYADRIARAEPKE